MLKDNPGLRPPIPDFGQEAYLRGIERATEETNREEDTLPATLEGTGWTWAQVLDFEFYPD